MDTRRLYEEPGLAEKMINNPIIPPRRHVIVVGAGTRAKAVDGRRTGVLSSIRFLDEKVRHPGRIVRSAFYGRRLNRSWTGIAPAGDLRSMSRAPVAAAAGGVLRADTSPASFDAIGPDSIRYQIKARRLVMLTPSRQLSTLRNLHQESLDVLIVPFGPSRDFWNRRHPAPRPKRLPPSSGDRW